MSKLKLIKSIRFCERWGSINPSYKEGTVVLGSNIPNLEYYFNSRGSTRKLSIYESGIGGRNRIVEVDGQGGDPIIGDNFSSKVAKYLYPIEYLKKDFDKLAWRESEYGEDAFLFQYLATQAAILRREKVWFGTSNQSTIWTDSGMNDKTLSEWWGGDIVKNKNSNEFKSKYFGQSINETDLKWRKTYTYTPPYFEIIQDPYIEPVDQIDKNKLELRSFGGSDPYHLNNGAKVVIEWSKDGYFVGGDNYSDNWQRELNGYDIGKTPLDQISKKITIWGPSSSFTLAEEVNDSGSKDIGFLDQKELIFNEDQNIYFRKKDFKGLYDDDIIKQVVDKWRLVYSNEKLALTERWDYYGNKPTLEFISPVLSTIIGTGPSASLITTSASVATSSTGITGATGASASRIHGSYIFDVRKTGYLINIDLGELTILEKESIEDPFIANNFEQTDDYGNVIQLSSEYIESEYIGPDEDIDLVTGVSFNMSELERNEDISTNDIDQQSSVQSGGSNVISPSGSVPVGEIILPPELSAVQNSKVIKKQSMGGSLRDVKDIVSPSGQRLNAVDIVRDMNQFIQDVLNPFAKWLKYKYPSLYKNWYITSATRGYIPKGGSLTSQHMKGQAIDSQIIGASAKSPNENIKLLNAILEWYKFNPVGYGQILFETRGNSCWIHWSYNRGTKRLMLARFAEDNTKKTPANKIGSYVLPPLSASDLGFNIS